MRKSSSSLFGPQFGGYVVPKNTERRVFVQADGTLKVTDEPRRSSRRGCCGEGSSIKGYDDALCFVSCIGQTRGTQTRIINQISEEVSKGTSSFPVKRALQTAGGLISTKKPSSVTLGRRDQKWVTALHCVDLNTAIDEEQTYSSFVEFCYHISAAIIIVVDDASYDKILYALRRIPEILDRKVIAAFVFLNWETKHAVGQKFPCGTLMEASDFQNCADLNNPGTSEAFRLVAIAAMRFSKVIIGFSDTWAIDLKLPEILPFCEPLKWRGETSRHGDMYTILHRVASAVNKRYSTGAHNRAVIELPIVSNRNRDIPDDGDRNKLAATSRDIDQTVSSAQKVPSVAMTPEQPLNSNNDLQMQQPLSPNVPPPPPTQQPLHVAVKSTQPQSPTATSVPHTQSPYTSHTPRPLIPTNINTRPVSPAPSHVWSNPSAPPLAIQRPPIFSTISGGPQASQVSPPVDALTWLRQHGAFSRVHVALCAEFLNESVSANNVQMFELPPEITESQNTSNFKEAKFMYDMFLEDVKALRTAAQQSRYDLSQILKIAGLTDASLTAQVNAVQKRAQNVQFKFKPEENQLQKILAAVTDKMIGEFQVKCSLHFERQLLHTNTVIDYVMKQYESFMKTATSESYFSDKQFKKMHDHILDQLEPKLTRLRGFETRQEELKNQFIEIFKSFKDENRKRVRQFQREREGAIKNVLGNLQVLNELFPGMDARELTEASWEIFAIRVKDHPESRGKLYAEEVAAVIRDEVKDMTGNVDEDAVFCLEDFETAKGGGIFVPKCLENKLRSALKSGDDGRGAITSKNDPQGGATEPELKRELEDLINRARELVEQGPPMGSVLESYINKRIQEATETLSLTGASNFKIRHAAEQLKIVIEKLE